MDHDQLLEKLLATFPGQVFLVNRYRNNDLDLDEDGVMRLFLPDFHWMSKDRAEYYTGGYRFNGNLLLSNNKPVFQAFLEMLEGQKPAELEVFQVGDCYDIWREIRDETETVEEAFLRIQTDPKISGLISRLNAFNTTEVRGNHDNWLVNLPGRYPERKDAKELDVAGGKIHVSHGHLYDSFEMIVPDAIKSEVVRRVPKAKAGSKNIGLISRRDYQEIASFIRARARRGDTSLFSYPEIKLAGAMLITQAADLDEIEKDYLTSLDVSIFSKQSGTRNDFDHIEYLSFADQIYVAEQNHPSNHSVHAIGHTHQARILVDRLPNGSPHVVLDCGGLIENCKVLTRPKGRPFYVPSAQFAAQFGKELRIYQLGGNY